MKIKVSGSSEGVQGWEAEHVLDETTTTPIMMVEGSLVLLLVNGDTELYTEWLSFEVTNEGEGE